MIRHKTLHFQYFPGAVSWFPLFFLIVPGFVTELRSNFNTREINSREICRLFGHNSEPCGNLWTILRHKLPIIHPDLPIPCINLNSNVQPEFLNPNIVYKTEQSSRVLTAERKILMLPLLELSGVAAGELLRRCTRTDSTRLRTSDQPR